MCNVDSKRPEIKVPFCPFCCFLHQNPTEHYVFVTGLVPDCAPLGLPFNRMDPNLSYRKRARIHLQWALHIMVLALNYWHFDGFVPVEQLGRVPSSLHMHVFLTLKRLLRSEVPASPFRIVKAGRRFPQLNARLSELCHFTSCLGLSGQPYSRSYQGAEVPADNSTSPELEPYMSLSASRLKLSITGMLRRSWTMDLCLPIESPTLSFALESLIPGRSLVSMIRRTRLFGWLSYGIAILC